MARELQTTKSITKSDKKLLFTPEDYELGIAGWGIGWNPLRFLTIADIQNIMDLATRGSIARLQYLYSLVEQSNLTLGMCIEKREAARGDWLIKRRENISGQEVVDDSLANEQTAVLQDVFDHIESTGTLTLAIAHLQKAVFRGLAIVQPVWKNNGKDNVVDHLVCLDNWNFCYDPKPNEFGQYQFYWNPKAQDVIDFKRTLDAIPSNEIIVYKAQRAIDSYGLEAYLASQCGEDSYGQLIARRGLPASYIIAPENLPPEKMEVWRKAAEKAARGGSGAFPYGTQIITSNIVPQNADAIQKYLEWQERKIVLASTGGLLTSLTAATGMGSNVAEVQEKVFKQIVRKDASNIAQLLDTHISKPILNAMFPGKPHLAYFDIGYEEELNPTNVLQNVKLAKDAGLTIDISQIEELTGYRFVNNEASNQDTTDESLESKEWIIQKD